MKIHKLVYFSSAATLVAVVSSVVTFVAVTRAVANHSPLAQTFGLSPSLACAKIEFSQLPGDFTARMVALLARAEPADEVITLAGFLEEVDGAALGDIARIPSNYFHSRSQPLFTAMLKTIVLAKVALRVVNGERVEPKDRVALISILERAGQIRAAALAAGSREQPGCFKNNESMDVFVTDCHRAVEVLRHG